MFGGTLSHTLRIHPPLQERHADQLEAAADQHAAETKAATAAAKEARDAAQRLQHALEAMGFAPKWARAALRVTGREAAVDERSRRSAALDWLCLHVPLDQMPALLMRVRLFLALHLLRGSMRLRSVVYSISLRGRSSLLSDASNARIRVRIANGCICRARACARRARPTTTAAAAAVTAAAMTNMCGW